jgi:hypothetical protein
MLNFALAASVFSFASGALAHTAILDVYGANSITGHGFGVDLTGRFPRTGTSGDAGGDSTIFEAGVADPSPACGETGEDGTLVASTWVEKAEADGVPSAYSNGSVVALAFQVDADGGGPMWCQVNEDATLDTWMNMTMNLNQAGNFGTQEDNNRVNETIVTTFPSGTACTGGTDSNICVVRCRTGVNKEYGGCFAVKLSDTTFISTAELLASVNPGSSLARRAFELAERAVALTTAQTNQLVDTIVTKMKSRGTVVKKSAAKRHLQRHMQSQDF